MNECDTGQSSARRGTGALKKDVIPTKGSVVYVLIENPSVTGIRATERNGRRQLMTRGPQWAAALQTAAAAAVAARREEEAAKTGATNRGGIQTDG
jgi:hypothetical protein